MSRSYSSTLSDANNLSSIANIAVPASKTQRLLALDLQRGLIMILMAFSHCREYVGVDWYANLYWDMAPAWLGRNWLDIFQQIAVSTVAAGGFYMMMGVGVCLLWHARIADGQSPQTVFNYLFKRGLLLMLVQLTLLQAFELLATQTGYFYAGVLLTLGICMIAAAGCMRLIHYLNARTSTSWDCIIPLIVAVLILCLSQLLMHYLRLETSPVAIWQRLLFVGGDYYDWGIRVAINFTPLPWFPAVAVGLMIGYLLQYSRNDADKILTKIVIIALLSWFALRTIDLFGGLSLGDYKLPSDEPLTWVAYFSMSKFPPSLTYFLWACSINLLGILLWHKVECNVAWAIYFMKPFKVFGQCALFFFIMHWFIYYGLSCFLSEKVTSPSAVISLWLLGLVILYPLCNSYRTFKLQKPKASIWRMF